MVKKGGDVTPKCVSGVSGLCQHIFAFFGGGICNAFTLRVSTVQRPGGKNLWLFLSKSGFFVRLKMRKINLTVRELIPFLQSQSIAPPITAENTQTNTFLAGKDTFE